MPPREHMFGREGFRRGMDLYFQAPRLAGPPSPPTISSLPWPAGTVLGR